MGNGITNSPFAKNCMTVWPIIKTVGTILGIAIVLWLQATLFTREEGEALKHNSATKAELKEAVEDIEVVEDQVQGIKTEIHGFKIEQRHTNEQLSKIVRFMEVEHSNRTNP